MTINHNICCEGCYRIGRQEERKELIKKFEEIIDEILLNPNNISKGYVEISTIKYFKQKLKEIENGKNK